MRTLTAALAALVCAIAPLGAAAQVDAPAEGSGVPGLSLEHRMLVRCSAAFALVSHQQANPPASAAVQNARLMSERAREFFVISSARVMDEAALSREQISAVLRKEAQALSQGNALEQILPPCLQMLRASGL